MCGEKQALRDPRDIPPKDPEALFEEALQKKRREARLYGYNDLLEEIVR